MSCASPVSSCDGGRNERDMQRRREGVCASHRSGRLLDATIRPSRSLHSSTPPPQLPQSDQPTNPLSAPTYAEKMHVARPTKLFCVRFPVKPGGPFSRMPCPPVSPAHVFIVISASPFASLLLGLLAGALNTKWGIDSRYSLLQAFRLPEAIDDIVRPLSLPLGLLLRFVNNPVVPPSAVDTYFCDRFNTCR